MESKYKIGQTVIYHTDYDEGNNEFTIKRIEYEPAENFYPERYVYYDSEKYESGMLLYEEDIDGLSPNHINITRENLEENGWIFDEEEYIRMKELQCEEFKVEVWRKEFTINDKTFYCDLRNISNTHGRDWFVHVDNNRCEGVASLDVATYGQIDRLLKLLTE